MPRLNTISDSLFNYNHRSVRLVELRGLKTLSGLYLEGVRFSVMGQVIGRMIPTSCSWIFEHLSNDIWPDHYLSISEAEYKQTLTNIET